MQFKFITLNLWRGGLLFDQIIEFIHQENPDILALQEVYKGKEEHLEKHFRTYDIFQKELYFPHSIFSPTFIHIYNGKKYTQGNAIFSRFPINSTKSIFYNEPYGEFLEEPTSDFSLVPRNLQNAILQINNTMINVYNTQGVWGYDGYDNEKRLHMSQIIVNEINNKENVILAGDFNVLPHTQTIKNIEKHLKNVFKDELTTTFNTKQKTQPGTFSTSVVDMIFVSKDIEVVDHYCRQVDISDHLPLVVIFNI